MQTFKIHVDKKKENRPIQTKKTKWNTNRTNEQMK